MVTVQRALGHSSATITLATYAHLWPSAEDRTRKATAVVLRNTQHLRVAIIGSARGATQGSG